MSTQFPSRHLSLSLSPSCPPPFSRTELQGCRILDDMRSDFSGPAQQEMAGGNITVCRCHRKASGNLLRKEVLNPSISLGPEVAIASAPLYSSFWPSALVCPTCSMYSFTHVAWGVTLFLFVFRLVNTFLRFGFKASSVTGLCWPALFPKHACLKREQ